MRLARLHPGWDRSCTTCEAYRVREDGTFVLDKRTALPMARVPGVPTPCHKCEKVPADAREAGIDWRELRKLARDMTPANREAVAFYRRCRGTGRFPDDPIVDWYAGLIREAEDLADQAERRAALSMTAALAALANPRR